MTIAHYESCGCCHRMMCICPDRRAEECHELPTSAAIERSAPSPSSSAELSLATSAVAADPVGTGGRKTSSRSSQASGSGAVEPAAVRIDAALWKQLAKNERARRLAAVARQLDLATELAEAKRRG